MYGIKAHREVHHSQISESDQELPHKETHPDAHEDLNECEVQLEQPKKRQKLTENQEKYNNEMIKQTEKAKTNVKLEIWSRLKLIGWTRHPHFIQIFLWVKLKKLLTPMPAL